jgi:hypothetical protein
MRGLLAVARREIEEKRFVFLAAAVVSLVPFAVPLVKGMHGSAATEMRDCVALILAATFAAGLAVGLGSTVLASDLAERRIGFYFSRPITGLGLWAGKLGAACLIALGAAAIVYAPTLAVNGGRVVLIDLPQETPAAFFAAVAAMVLLMHAGNIAMRPRSPLLALDLVALVLLALGAVFVLQRLTRAFAMVALVRATTFLTVVVTVAVATAGFAAVLLGRSDTRRAHLVLSITLWGILGVGVAALAGYTEWALSATPRDLTAVDAALPAGRGSWIMVEGPARGGLPAFLFDTATGRYERSGADWRWPVLSPDGAHAAWFDPSASGGPMEVVTLKLDDPGSKPVRTNLFLSGMLFLSEHGERLATISGGLLSVYDLTTAASLGSARVGDERTRLRGFFLDRNRFRVFRPNGSESVSGGRLDILEFDTSTKTLATICAIEDVDEIAYSVSHSGDRLLVREKSRLALRDGRSGALIASLAERGPTTTSLGRFVSRGRIVVSVAEGSNVRVEVFAMDGQHERTIPIPARDRISLGGEIAPGKLLVAAGGDSKERENRTIFLADLSSGDVRQVADRLFPVVYLAGWVSNSPNYQPEPGSEATKLFYGPGRSLVHFDPLTGERRVILAGSSR